MADPALNLQVTADITALMTSMQAAQNAVNQTTAAMAASLGKVPKDVQVSVDTTSIDELTTSLDAVPKDVAVNVDTSSIEAAAAAVKTLPKDVQLTADASGLQAAMQAAAQSATDASAKIAAALAAVPKDVRLTADASQMTAGFGEAQASVRQTAEIVKTSTQQMTQAVERMSLGQRFDAAMSQAARSAKRLNFAMDATRSAALAASGDIEGAMNALPGVFGAVASSAFSLGGALHEAFTGAKAALAEAAAEAEKLERRSGFKALQRDAERLLEIETEADPIRKLELERQNAIAVARRQARQAASDGAGHEAAAAAAAEERVINAQYDNKIREATSRIAREQADAERRLADEAMRKAEQAEKEASARAAASDRGRRLLEDANAEKQIALAMDDATRRRLELEKDLRDIERERIENAKEMGEALAMQVAEAQAGMRIAREEIELRNELADVERDIAAEQESARGRMQMTQTVETSFGGGLVVANQSAQRGIAVATEKQVRLQERIADLVAQIAEAQRNQGIQ